MSERNVMMINQLNYNILITGVAKEKLRSILTQSRVENPVLGLSFGKQKLVDKNSGEVINEIDGWFVNVFQRENVSSGHKLHDNDVELILISHQFFDKATDRVLDYTNGKFYFKTT